MYLDSKTRQHLLELVYDALPDDEATALWRQIESDSEMARAYADARRTAGLIADAARIRAPHIERTRREHSAASGGPPRTNAAARGCTAPAARRPQRRSGRGIGAAILLLVAIGTLVSQRGQWADLAAEHFRLLLTGPARFEAGAGQPFRAADHHHNRGTSFHAGRNDALDRRRKAVAAPEGVDRSRWTPGLDGSRRRPSSRAGAIERHGRFSG